MNTPDDYIFFTYNTNELRLNKTDSLDFSVKKKYKSKDQTNWHRITSTIHTNGTTGYKRRVVMLKRRQYTQSRIVYMAHNPKWDITDITINNRVGHKDSDPTNIQIDNLTLNYKSKYNFYPKALGISYVPKYDNWSCYIGSGSNKIRENGYETMSDAIKAREKLVADNMEKQSAIGN
jgi:hypothetical protein